MLTLFPYDCHQIPQSLAYKKAKYNYLAIIPSCLFAIFIISNKTNTAIHGGIMVLTDLLPTVGNRHENVISQSDKL